MKLYTIQRVKDGLLLTCEGLNKKNQVEKSVPEGPFDIGNASKETKALALAIMSHYYGASPSDPGATAEAQRKAGPFQDAFLLAHSMPLNAKYEISSDVIDRFFALSTS